MKIIYNLFYFIWYGIDSIVNIAYEAVKDNEKVGVIFYIGGEDADADFKDVDLHQVIDELKELTPRLNNKIDELKNEGIRMIKIAYSSFTLFWSNLWHFIVDFIMNYPNLVNNIIQIGGNWIDAQFWQYIGGYSDLILYVYVILVYAIAGV